MSEVAGLNHRVPELEPTRESRESDINASDSPGEGDAYPQSRRIPPRGGVGSSEDEPTTDDSRLGRGAVLGALLGYYLGVRRTRRERIDERRDTAIADIFGALWRHYRHCITWARIGRDFEWKESVSVRERYENFLDCYYTRSIWLGKDTRELVEKYARVSGDFYERLRNEMDSAGYLADRTKAIDLLNHELEPAFTNVEDKLRAEMSVPRSS